MREQLQIRLEELKKEFDVGQTRLQELDRQQTALRETLLRISGAIQVLEEMLISAEQAQTPLTQSASSTS
jgi:predicted nuclease with TOPRIM domain